MNLRFERNMTSYRLNLPLLESFIEVHGIDGILTKLDDKGSPPIKLIAELSPSINIVGHLSKEGVVEKVEVEFRL